MLTFSVMMCAYCQANFGQFRSSDLKDWEQHILCTIDFEIEPQLTPTAFVASLLCVWATDVDKSAVAATADGLIAEFLEGSVPICNVKLVF